MAQYYALLDEDYGDVISAALVKRNSQVQDELNVKLKCLELDAADRGTITKLSNLVIAGDDAFDFALAMEWGVVSWLQQPELLIELHEVPNLDLTHSWWNQAAMDEYTINGKLYNAPGDICFYALAAPITIFFNKTVAQNANIGNLYDLVRDGKWTVDKVMELCQKVYKDVNGNGQVDVEEDIIGICCEQSTNLHWLLGSNMRLTEKDKDGNISLVVNNEKTVSLIEKTTKLFQDEKLCCYAQNLEKTYKSPYTDLFAPKIKADTALFYSNQLLVALDLRDMDSDFGILPTPKWDDKQENYYSFSNTAWNDMLIVPTTNSNLARTGHVAEAMGYYGQQYVRPAFIDSTVLSRDIRDEDSAEMVDMILSSQVYDLGATFNWGSLTNVLYKPCNNKDASTFASNYASLENGILTAMNKMIDTLKGK